MDPEICDDCPSCGFTTNHQLIDVDRIFAKYRCQVLATPPNRILLVSQVRRCTVSRTMTSSSCSSIVTCGHNRCAGETMWYPLCLNPGSIQDNGEKCEPAIIPPPWCHLTQGAGSDPTFCAGQTRMGIEMEPTIL